MYSNSFADTEAGHSRVPWRLVVFIVLLGAVVIFAGLNINNTSDVSFGFWKIEGVPIFISLFFAFVVGVITMAPFVIGKGGKNKKKAVDTEPAPEPEEPPLPDV